MPNPPANLPFASDVDDAELEAELEKYRPEQPDQPVAAPVVTEPSASAPRMAPAPERAPMPAPAIQTMPPVKSTQPASREAEDMFSNLDQSPKKSPAPTGLGDLPMRSSPSVAKYVVFSLLGVVVLGGLGFGFWYFAVKRPAMERAMATPAVVAPVIPATTPPSNAPVVPEPTPVVASPPAADPTIPGSGSSDLPSDAPLPTPVVTPPAGTNIPPPEVVAPAQDITVTNTTDTDEDGLSDQRELELGTDPRNKDTDTDELSDGDEVLKYGTNPLDADTDKDAFSDGKEVQNSYNPRGSGKCSKPDCTI